MRGAPPRSACPTELLDNAADARGASRRSISPASPRACYEPRFGALMARRAVQTLVAEFVQARRRLPPGADRSAGPIRRARSTMSSPAPASASPRSQLRLRLRALARAASSRPARPAHLPDPAGSLLLRPAARRRALRAGRRCPAGRISTAATSITASPTSKAAASRSPTTRTARRSTPTPATARPRADGAGRRRAPSWPAASRRWPAAAQRGAGLPI